MPYIFCTYLRISHKGFCGIWIDISVPAIPVEFPLDWLYLRIIECCINYFFAIRGYPNGIITLQYVLWKRKKNIFLSIILIKAFIGSISSSFLVTSGLMMSSSFHFSFFGQSNQKQKKSAVLFVYFLYKKSAFAWKWIHGYKKKLNLLHFFVILLSLQNWTEENKRLH